MIRLFELGVLYISIPLLLAIYGASNPIWIIILWSGTLLAGFTLVRHYGLRLRDIWRWEAVSRETLKPMLMRFAVCALPIAMFVWWILPERLFSFPLERPAVWALVMLLYPPLSAMPQEFLFRVFFFERYKTLFTSPRAMIMASALLFGYAHIFLRTGLSVGLSAIAGLFFADTYSRHRSLALVTIEHALYGCFIFTIGLGRYFYHGAK